LPVNRPPGRVRTAYFQTLEVLVVYQTPREKKPSSARTTTTIRMIQRMLTKASFDSILGALLS
jgi:hypothetical protein